jgi:hypothetical protein
MDRGLRQLTWTHPKPLSRVSAFWRKYCALLPLRIVRDKRQSALMSCHASACRRCGHCQWGLGLFFGCRRNHHAGLGCDVSGAPPQTLVPRVLRAESERPRKLFPDRKRRRRPPVHLRAGYVRGQRRRYLEEGDRQTAGRIRRGGSPANGPRARASQKPETNPCSTAPFWQCS